MVMGHDVPSLTGLQLTVLLSCYLLLSVHVITLE